VEAEHRHELVQQKSLGAGLLGRNCSPLLRAWIFSIQRILPTKTWLPMPRLLPMAQNHHQVRCWIKLLPCRMTTNHTSQLNCHTMHCLCNQCSHQRSAWLVPCLYCLAYHTPLRASSTCGSFYLRPANVCSLTNGLQDLHVTQLCIPHQHLSHRMCSYPFCDTKVLIHVQVLIVDVMTVPDTGSISHTTQGKYLVAIVLPSIALGGLAQWYLGWLARRCGCIVGGFCLAMWIETLCPGGLIKTSQKTAILIGVMCAVSLAPTISMFKKWVDIAYVVFSSFSGSTALVLGIDCYSRAGLKEFWIYTWRTFDPNHGISLADI
jgi:hypothetical protein